MLAFLARLAYCMCMRMYMHMHMVLALPLGAAWRSSTSGAMGLAHVLVIASHRNRREEYVLPN